MKKPFILLLTTAALIFSKGIFSADISKGKEKSESCVACHGANGISVNPIWPNLAGQHPKYIKSQLTFNKICAIDHINIDIITYVNSSIKNRIKKKGFIINNYLFLRV